MKCIRKPKNSKDLWKKIQKRQIKRIKTQGRYTTDKPKCKLKKVHKI
mgnify:FL=1